jgi:spore coat polysaccharide biosynthesis protein SpsF (cytidylyltransferase family)
MNSHGRSETHDALQSQNFKHKTGYLTNHPQQYNHTFRQKSRQPKPKREEIDLEVGTPRRLEQRTQNPTENEQLNESN